MHIPICHESIGNIKNIHPQKHAYNSTRGWIEDSRGFITIYQKILSMHAFALDQAPISHWRYINVINSKQYYYPTEWRIVLHEKMLLKEGKLPIIYSIEFFQLIMRAQKTNFRNHLQKKLLQKKSWTKHCRIEKLVYIQFSHGGVILWFSLIWGSLDPNSRFRWTIRFQVKIPHVLASVLQIMLLHINVHQKSNH